MNPSEAEASAPTARPAPTRLRVGDFQLDVTANEISGPDGRVQRIEPRLMALLVRLAREPGAVVARETLIDEVWSRRMVNDEVLSRAVADLRQALGDDSRTPRYIETIPKSGYRLIAAVTVAAESASPPAAPPQRRRALWPVWLAVGLATLMVGTAIWIVTLKQSGVQRTETGAAGWDQALEVALREAQPLTASLGLEIGPRLSPDGKRVLYSLIENGRATLMLHDPALPAPRAISEAGEDVTSAVFLPDGVGIVYRSLTDTACKLRLKTAQGLRDIAVCARDEPSRIDMSPDGQWLVRSKAHRDSLPAGLALQSLQSDALRQLTLPGTADGEDSLPRFSPDGTQIAFVRGNSSARSIWIVAAQGGEPRKLSTLSGLTYGLAWLPDGTSLLVAADWFGFRALNLLKLADGSGRLLGARGARAPDFAAGRIVYENAIFQANLVRVPMGRASSTESPAVSPVDPAKLAPLHPSTRYSSQQVYSPDGSAVVFVSNREGVEALFVATGDTLRKLPLPDTHRYMRPQWSADGTSIYAVRLLANAAKTGPQQAVRIRVADGTSSVLPVGDNVSFVGESRDGRWLYVGEREERLMRLWRAPVDTPAKLERLPVPLVGDVQFNRDRIAFTQTGLQGITVCSLDGQACELKRVPTGHSHDDHWAMTNGGLYFVEGNRAARRLKRHDLRTGAVTTISSIIPTTLGAGLAVHPQESEFIVAREQPPSIDLMSATVVVPK